MGDSFNFLTVDDDVTPSNSSGCNGFPFKYGVNGPPPFVIGRRFPVAVPLGDCGVPWWKGKNYSVSTDISATYNSITLAYPNGAMTPEGGNATRELDLTDPGRRHGWNFGVFVLYDSSAGVQLILNSGSFYPYIYVLDQLVPDPSGPTPPSLGLSTDSGDFTPTTSIPMTISGGSLIAAINLTLYLKNNGLDSFTGTHFDLTIISEWGY